MGLRHRGSLVVAVVGVFIVLLLLFGFWTDGVAVSSSSSRLQITAQNFVVDVANMDLAGFRIGWSGGYSEKGFAFVCLNNDFVCECMRGSCKHLNGWATHGWEPELNAMLWLALEGRSENPEELSVVDLGTNQGAFSLYALSLGLTVHSFEMNPRLVDGLKMSVSLNGELRFAQRWHVYQAALAGVDDKEVSFKAVSSNVGATPLLLTGGSGTDVKVLKSKRFDSLFPKKLKIFFLKVDIEGSEERVVPTLKEYFKENLVSWVYIETAKGHPACIQLLYQHGFRCGESLYDGILPEDLWLSSEVATNAINNMDGTKQFIDKGYWDIFCTIEDYGKYKELFRRHREKFKHINTLS